MAVKLRLYLDDCAYSHLLADLLRQAGHAVTFPAAVGLAGAHDHLHFAWAVQNGCITVTKNPADFSLLHELNPGHPGVFAIYQDNDAHKDMSAAEIVAAIARLEQVYSQARVPLDGQFHVLNQWQTPAPPPSPSSPSQPTSPSPSATGGKSEKRKKRKG
jgi:predicted nuclease of predicted toxin-antitoxin system